MKCSLITHCVVKTDCSTFHIGSVPDGNIFLVLCFFPAVIEKYTPEICMGLELINLGTGYLMRACVKCEVAQSCLTLCNPMDCSLPGSSLHEILLQLLIGV